MTSEVAAARRAAVRFPTRYLSPAATARGVYQQPTIPDWNLPASALTSPHV
jgi:hypothetical protein